jgi:putative transposase
VDFGHDGIKVSRQCELLGLNRSRLYYQPVPEDEENIRLMNLIDEEFLKHPFYGRRRISAWLRRQGEMVNEKRVGRLMGLMGLMGLEAIYPEAPPEPPGEVEREIPLSFAWACD